MGHEMLVTVASVLVGIAVNAAVVAYGYGKLVSKVNAHNERLNVIDEDIRHLKLHIPPCKELLEFRNTVVADFNNKLAAIHTEVVVIAEGFKYFKETVERELFRCKEGGKGTGT